MPVIIAVDGGEGKISIIMNLGTTPSQFKVKKPYLFGREGTRFYYNRYLLEGKQIGNYDAMK